MNLAHRLLAASVCVTAAVANETNLFTLELTDPDGLAIRSGRTVSVVYPSGKPQCQIKDVRVKQADGTVSFRLTHEGGSKAEMVTMAMSEGKLTAQSVKPTWTIDPGDKITMQARNVIVVSELKVELFCVSK